jgi:dynactin 1
MISGLNKDLQQAKEEVKTITEAYAAYKEEMSNHEQRIEEITVDKELAEAKVEELEDEMEKLNEKFEETKLELEVLKSEIEISGKEGATSTYQNKQMEKESENLKVALIKLRDLSLQDKSEINSMRKQLEDLTQKVKVFSKENETLKTEKSSNLVQINELKDQVYV